MDTWIKKAQVHSKVFPGYGHFGLQTNTIFCTSRQGLLNSATVYSMSMQGHLDLMLQLVVHLELGRFTL